MVRSNDMECRFGKMECFTVKFDEMEYNLARCNAKLARWSEARA